MTAISLYISTCRYVMQADTNDSSTWADLYRYLPVLRQALSCCVCGHIISKPRGPSHSECLHNVCAKCIGGKMRFKPACSWCKDYVDFRDNIHLRILVLCFQKLCKYIHSSQIWSELSSSSQNGEKNSLVSIINEAIAFEDDNIPLAPPPVPPVTMPVLTPAMVGSPGRKRRVSHKDYSTDDVSEASLQEPPTLSPELETNPFDKNIIGKSKNDKYDVGHMVSPIHGNNRFPSEHSNQLTLSESSSHHRRGRGRGGNRCHRKQHRINSKGQSIAKPGKSRGKSLDGKFEPPSKRTRAASLPSVSDLSKKLCKCAKNHPPNRLTCLGQRCPCYSSRSPCIGCKCRGCRNPRNEDDVCDSTISPAENDFEEINVTELSEAETE